MRILWTMFKVIIGLAIMIPLGFLVFVTGVGILGGLLGLAMLALRFAFLALVGYGVFRLARRVLGFGRKPAAQPLRELPKPDPYYEAAMRELDAEMKST